MIDKIKSLLDEISNLTASNLDEVEALRIKYLSKKGEITSLMNDFRNVPAEQKGDIIHIRVSKRKMLRAMASAAAIIILWIFSSPVNEQRASVSCAGMITKLEFSRLQKTEKPAIQPDTLPQKDSITIAKADKPAAVNKDSIKEFRYFIVLGSFQTEHAANRHKVQLTDIGVPHVGVKKMGSKMRTYLKGFSNKDTAMKYMNKIRDDRQEYNEAWLYCIK